MTRRSFLAFLTRHPASYLHVSPSINDTFGFATRPARYATRTRASALASGLSEAWLYFTRRGCGRRSLYGLVSRRLPGQSPSVVAQMSDRSLA